jgi:hypothetical protein
MGAIFLEIIGTEKPGRSGRLKSRRTPWWYAYMSIKQAVNSLPLSTKTFLGAP